MGSLKIACVTSFSPAGFRAYGRTMLDSFIWGWPKDIPIYVYHEGDPRPSAWNQCEHWIDLNDDKDRAAFMARHKDEGLEYRWWPVKFCHKVFAITSAPRDCDWLVWLDGDIETTQPITHEFLASILPDDAVATYLGRRYWHHTETGFVAYNMQHFGGDFLDALREHYVSDAIMEGSQLHDCMAFDHVRQTFEGLGRKFHDLGDLFRLTQGRQGVDVMAHSALAKYLWHNKGEHRKLKAYGAVA